MTQLYHMPLKHLCLMLSLYAGPAAVAGASKIHNPHCARWHSGQCVECYYGWFGPQCERKCDRNCWTTGCYKGTGICEQCVPGRYGRHCKTRCPDNCRSGRDGTVNCDRVGGRCQEGCKEDWWGDTCSKRCNSNCKRGACIQQSGHCIGDCTHGWHGLHCDKQCSVGCRGNRCSCVTGVCTHGCGKGWSGETCEEQEQRRECSATCKTHECDTNGRCLKGCIHGFRGSSCNETCPVNCHICQQDTTSCTRCEHGWQGPICTSRTITHHHHRPSKKEPIFDSLDSPAVPKGRANSRNNGNVLLVLVAVIISAMGHIDLSCYAYETVRIQGTVRYILQKLRLHVKRLCVQIACHECTLVHAFVNWRFQRPSISDCMSSGTVILSP
ncbi:scavenger receptor class F member 1-like isoform X1 [Haliotis cracherodii]|uniref:scavenger receptor class F member 1-like isoform X1 n=1 Tax=Haliotis cracherodii TaxID=6455 RepID=UPI0039EBCAA5